MPRNSLAQAMPRTPGGKPITSIAGCCARTPSGHAARMALLGLYVRQGAPWFADLRAELLSFPAGKHGRVTDLVFREIRHPRHEHGNAPHAFGLRARRERPRGRFLQALGELGWIVGRNIRIDYPTIRLTRST